MRSQQDKIIDYLATGRTLTGIQALKRFGTMKLASRVSDLKRDGHPIEREIICVNGKRIARYRLDS